MAPGRVERHEHSRIPTLAEQGGEHVPVHAAHQGGVLGRQRMEGTVREHEAIPVGTGLVAELAQHVDQ